MGDGAVAELDEVPDRQHPTRVLVDGDGPFFTVDHFRGSTSVLVRLSLIGELSREELVEVLTDAWRTAAPPRLVREHDA